MLKRFKVYEFHREVPVWVIPEQLAMETGLKQDQPVELKCGSLSVVSTVMTSQSKDGSMGISRDVLNALKLPKELSLGVKACQDGSFQLGPVIGILTFPHVIKKRDFGRYIPYATRMKDSGLLYIFGPEDIDPATKTINGYYYNFSQKSWNSGEFPYPDVVMDRIYPNNANAHFKLEKVIGQNRIFNKRTLISKLDFYKAMNHDSLLREYVPETALLFYATDLKYFLRKYDGVFLKPVDGMKGRGIIYVLTEGNTLTCKYMENGKPVSEIMSRTQQIFSVLERINEKKRPYVIQAAVKRTEHLNRPFNFRTMVVKDGKGQWLVPAIFAKIAEPEGFLTNNSSGASFIPLNDLFQLIQNNFPHPKDQLLSLLTDLSLKTAAALDVVYGPLGKLGLDIAVDTAGKPWVIEANGNPGLMARKALGEYPDWSSQMYDYPLAYCFYLWGFPGKQD